MTDENKNILQKGQDGAKKLVDDVFGAFSKKQDYTENKDGSITRELKVCGKKVEVTARGPLNDSYVVFTSNTLDDKKKQKLIEKVEKGKKLSDDEELWLKLADREVVMKAMQSTIGQGYDYNADLYEVAGLSKDEVIGKAPIADISIGKDTVALYEDFSIREGRPSFLSSVKQEMIKTYGEELGTKRFEAFAQRSGLDAHQEKEVPAKEAEVKNEPEQEFKSITRELDVAGQKVNVEAIELPGGQYFVSNRDGLEKNNKQNLIQKVEKGEKLSDDEKLWLNMFDRTFVEVNMVELKIPEKEIIAATGYSKAEISGQTPVGDFSLDLSRFPADKVAALLEGIKENMILAYGEEFGTKHFEAFKARSMGGQEQALEAEAKKAPVQQQSPVAEGEIRITSEDRQAVKADMHREADAYHNTPVVVSAPAKGNVAEVMKDDANVAKIRVLMERPGVKLQQDKDETLNKLVANFGSEAAYQLVLKSMLEPANAMTAMGEDFKRSGASIEYFASIDVNDADKMAKVAALSGVSVEKMPQVAKNPELEVLSHDAKQAQGVKLNISNMNIQPSKMPETIKLPSQAEMKYDQLAAGKEQMTLADLEKAGVNLKTDLQPTLKALTTEGPESVLKLAPNGLNGKDSVVSKELAVALIERAQAREQLVLLKKHNRSR